MLWILLALIAAPPAQDDLIGRYTLVGEHGRVVCRLRMSFEPTVGGEIEAPPECAAALPIADGLQWSADKEGGYTIRNALHRPVGRIADSEAGYILYVGEKSYDLAGIDYVPPPPPATRAVGTWRVQNDAVPSRLLCRVALAKGGAIGSTAACPATMKPYGGGRWRADDDAIVLRAATGQTKRLAWEDDDDLNGDDLHLAFVRERRK